MVDIYAEFYRGMSQREMTACFTGHRKIPPGEEAKVMVRTRYIVQKLIHEHNVRYFGVGGAVGYDMLAAEYLIRLKAHKEHQLKIISVLPYPEWRDTEDWDDVLRRREDRILFASDKIVYVRPQKENGVYLLRDRKLVNGSAWCVSYCNRVPSGTAYTVRYALKHGVKVMNASSFDVRSLLR